MLRVVHDRDEHEQAARPATTTATATRSSASRLVADLNELYRLAAREMIAVALEA